MIAYLGYVIRSIRDFIIYPFNNGGDVFLYFVAPYGAAMMISFPFGMFFYGFEALSGGSGDKVRLLGLKFFYFVFLWGPLGIFAIVALSAFVIGFFRFRKRVANKLVKK